MTPLERRCNRHELAHSTLEAGVVIEPELTFVQLFEIPLKANHLLEVSLRWEEVFLR